MRRHAKALVATTAIFILLGATAAFGLQTHTSGTPFDGSQVPNGSFGTLGGLAVDQSGGDVYVIDTSGSEVNSSGAVQRFDSAGVFKTPQLHGGSTTAGNLSLFNESHVAIDSSGTASDGTAYVTDSFNNLLVAFDPATGNLESAFDTDGELSGSATPAPAGSFSTPCGVAVDQSNGNVFVADQNNARIWIFDSSGKYLDRIADSTLSGPCSITFDSAGELYIRNVYAGNVAKFHRESPTAYDFQGVVDSGGSTDIAVNPAGDHLYVDKGNRIVEYDAGGAVVSTFGQGVLSDSHGIAIDSTSGTVYASNANELRTFSPLVVLPDVTTGAVSSVTGAAATLTGSLDPAGGPETTACSFEWGTDTSYGNSAPCSEGNGFTSPEDVSVEITGLSAATEYHYRLNVANPNGPTNGADRSFATNGAPVVSYYSPANIEVTSAVLKTRINPSGAATTYRFEYVDNAEFQVNGFLNATKVPVPDGSLKAGNTTQAVSEMIGGLTQETGYRFRVVAANTLGTTTTVTKIFKTFAVPGSVGRGQFPGQGFLPNNRAWEMVSPLNKQGTDVARVTTRTSASPDGSSLVFTASQAYGDAIGTGLATDYMAQRSTDPQPGDNGWTTHAITPQQKTMTLLSAFQFKEPFYADLSTDFSRGLLRAWSPVPTATDPHPMVENTENLYVRADLRTAGPGSFDLVTDCPLCTEPLPAQFGKPWAHAATSNDLSHVLFESSLNLVAGTKGSAPKVYESIEGSPPMAVGQIPTSGNSCGGAGPACEISVRSVPGSRAAAEQQGVMTDDGSRFFFTVGTVSMNNTTAGDLYMRDDQGTLDPSDDTTDKLNAVSDGDGGGLNTWAHFSTASTGVDESGNRTPVRAFFTTPRRLTADDTNEVIDLYRWSELAEDETQQLTVTATGGTFTLTFDGQTTPPLAFDASAATVENALNTLSSISGLPTPGTVVVSGGPGDASGSKPYTVVFGGSLGGEALSQVSGDASALVGGSASVNIETTIPGGHLLRLSVDDPASSDPSRDVSDVAGISDDGNYVYFVTSGQLVAGKPSVPSSLQRGVYLWHEGDITYIGGQIPTEPSDQLLMGRIWTFNFNVRWTRTTPDGRHFLFMSPTGSNFLSVHGGVDVDESNCSGDCYQIYQYASDTDELECVSCPVNGPPSMGVRFAAVRESSTQVRQHLSHVLSDDGRYVFFHTAERLVPSDTNGTVDAYEYDALSDKQYLLSSGESDTVSYVMDAAPDGRDVFIVTRERLSGWDRDNLVDLYDARIAGGFSEPPPPPASCTGDACQPPPMVPNDPTPASSTFEGKGNPHVSDRRRHKKRRHAAKHHHKKAKGNAKHDRRANR